MRSPAIVCLILILGCANQDYETPPPSRRARAEARLGDRKESLPTSRERLLGVEDTEEGYLWTAMRWIGLPETQMDAFKASLADSPNVTNFKTLGGSILGGAALGLITRASGSWFFGKPIDSKGPTWFWKRLDQTIKGSGQSMARGIMFSGGCYLALSGFTPLFYNGILGSQFDALSAAIALGATSAGMAGHTAHQIAKYRWTDENAKLARLVARSGRAKQAVEKYETWTNSTEIGKSIRYQIIPGLIIVGVGGGVGVIVYNIMQEEGDEEAEYEREQVRKQRLIR